jgi:peptidyl-prolyl cis-trans isomerase B (cyclophilin B)
MFQAFHLVRSAGAVRKAAAVRLGTGLCLLAVSAVLGGPVRAGAADPQFARLVTEQGNILLVFYPELAPHHVANFVHLCRTGYYDGTRFHRIVPGFVIQGGDPNSKDDDPRNDGMGGPTLKDVLTAQDLELVAKVDEMLAQKGYLGLQGQASLRAEFSRTVKHLRGALSMARSREPDSGGSQFFICVADAPQLDGQYTIFGHVVLGIEVADAIVGGEKNPAAGRDAPAIPVAIQQALVLSGTADLTPQEKAAWDALPDDLKSVR